MNRIDRLAAILIHLQSKKVVKAKEIAGRFGVSLRTVYRDIRALEEAGVPLGAEAGIGYFLAEGYHLPPVLFTQEEAGVLLMAGKLFEKFSDPAMRSHHESALYKIRSILDPADKEYVENLHAHITVFGHSGEEAGGSEAAVDKIPIAISRNRVVTLHYHSFQSQETTVRDVEPLGLCFYSAHWHLIAYCRLRKDYRDFRVDRIEKITILDETFDRENHDSLENLFKEMSSQEELEKIVVRFSEHIQNSVLNQRYFYGYIKEKILSDWNEMTFFFYSIEAFSYWLLSFGNQIQVISPPSLKERMVRHAQILSDYYLKKS
jgi:predicted DNA-binding transcriptional regulator YafY